MASEGARSAGEGAIGERSGRMVGAAYRLPIDPRGPNGPQSGGKPEKVGGKPGKPQVKPGKVGGKPGKAQVKPGKVGGKPGKRSGKAGSSWLKVGAGDILR